MADAIAGPAGNAVQVTPPDAEFKGPFTAASKSTHTMKNTSSSRICIKLKVFDPQMVQCKPIMAFMTSGQEMQLNLIHKPFPYNPAENYAARKVGIFYVDVPETKTDLAAFAKEVPAASWKVVKMLVKYNMGEGSAAAKGAQPPEAAAPPAEAPPAEAPPPS